MVLMFCPQGSLCLYFGYAFYDTFIIRAKRNFYSVMQKCTLTPIFYKHEFVLETVGIHPFLWRCMVRWDHVDPANNPHSWNSGSICWQRHASLLCQWSGTLCTIQYVQYKVCRPTVCTVWVWHVFQWFVSMLSRTLFFFSLLSF